MLLIGNICFTAYVFLNLKSYKDLGKDYSKDVLKVRGIVVVDSLGVERAILGAHLPEAQREGGRMYSSRSQTAVSGLMLYDSEGIERGGYVTDDDYGNIFFTLDGKTDQTVLFLAEPQGATTLRLWSQSGSIVSLSTSESGSDIELVDKGKTIKLKRDE